MTSISVYGYDPEMLAFRVNMDEKRIGTESGTVEAHKSTAGCTSFPFLELPYEVRAHIYSYVLPNTSHHPNHGPVWHRGTAPIWLASRQLYNECIPLFYGSCTFRIDVQFEGVTFLFRRAQQGRHSVLYPKSTCDFPEKIAARNRPLLRKFEIHLHQMDSYTGMIKYNYSNPEFLALGLKKQVEMLCQELQELEEIHDMQIYCDGGDAASCDALAPFWGLRNTHNICVTSSVMDPEQGTYACIATFQNHLQGALEKNSQLRLPS